MMMGGGDCSVDEVFFVLDFVTVWCIKLVEAIYQVKITNMRNTYQ